MTAEAFRPLQKLGNSIREFIGIPDERDRAMAKHVRHLMKEAEVREKWKKEVGNTRIDPQPEKL